MPDKKILSGQIKFFIWQDKNSYLAESTREAVSVRLEFLSGKIRILIWPDKNSNLFWSLNEKQRPGPGSFQTFYQFLVYK